MTLTLEQEKLVQHLFTACQTNKPLDRDTYVGVVNDFDTAYAVQDAVMSLKEEPTAGYKVSLTSPKHRQCLIQILHFMVPRLYHVF